MESHSIVRIDVGPLRLNATYRTVVVFDPKYVAHHVPLYPKEYDLLEMLCGRLDTMVSRKDIYDALWRGMAHKRSQAALVRKRYRSLKRKLAFRNKECLSHFRARSIGGQAWGIGLYTEPLNRKST